MALFDSLYPVSKKELKEMCSVLANVSLYQKFGFEIVKKFTIPSLNLPMWEMVRK